MEQQKDDTKESKGNQRKSSSATSILKPTNEPTAKPHVQAISHSEEKELNTTDARLLEYEEQLAAIREIVMPGVDKDCIIKMEQQVEEMEAEKVRLLDMIKNTQLQIENMEKERIKKQKEAADVAKEKERELDTLKHTNGELESELKATKEEMIELKKLNDKLTNERQLLEKKFEEYKNESEAKLKANHQLVENQNHELIEELLKPRLDQVSKDHLKAVEIQHKIYEEELKKMMTETNKAKSRVFELEKEIKTILSKPVNKALSEMRDQCEKSKQDSKLLEEELGNTRQMVGIYQAQVDELNEKLKSSMRESQNTAEQNKKLQQDLRDLKEQKDKELSGITQAIDALRRENMGLNQSLQKYWTEIVNLQNRELRELDLHHEQPVADITSPTSVQGIHHPTQPSQSTAFTSDISREADRLLEEAALARQNYEATKRAHMEQRKNRSASDTTTVRLQSPISGSTPDHVHHTVIIDDSITNMADHSETTFSNGMNSLMEEVERVANQIRADTQPPNTAEVLRESMTDHGQSVHPYDPNLTCGRCGKQFRFGEIQKCRRHLNEFCKEKLNNLNN